MAFVTALGLENRVQQQEELSVLRRIRDELLDREKQISAERLDELNKQLAKIEQLDRPQPKRAGAQIGQ